MINDTGVRNSYVQIRNRRPLHSKQTAWKSFNEYARNEEQLSHCKQSSKNKSLPTMKRNTENKHRNSSLSPLYHFRAGKEIKPCDK